VDARKTRGMPLLNALAGSNDHEPFGHLIRTCGLLHLTPAYCGGNIWVCSVPNSNDCS
jgi:hypothetical protein